MKVTLTYYGVLAEIAGTESEVLIAERNSTADLRALLLQKYPKLKGMTFQLAENNAILNSNDTITSDKLDVFPPFSGG